MKKGVEILVNGSVITLMLSLLNLLYIVLGQPLGEIWDKRDLWNDIPSLIMVGAFFFACICGCFSTAKKVL